MDALDIIAAIHKGGYEFDILEYLVAYVKDRNTRKELESCELRSSLDLIRTFNNKKWHIGLIENIIGGDDNRLEQLRNIC